MKYLFIGDTHFPFIDKAKLLKCVQWAKANQPDYILQIGDLYDMYAFSKYTKIVNDRTPEQELRKGRVLAEKMWKDFQTVSPKSKCYQLLGNHDNRVIQRVLEKLPGLDMRIKIKDKLEKLHNIDKLFEFDGVTTMLDYKAELKLGGMLIIHGFKGNIGEHVKFFMKNTVTGHMHRGGVAYLRASTKTLFELNCGFLGDVKSLPFQYTETRTKTATPGFGVVETECGVLVPRFIAL